MITRKTGNIKFFIVEPLSSQITGKKLIKFLSNFSTKLKTLPNVKLQPSYICKKEINQILKEKLTSQEHLMHAEALRLVQRYGESISLFKRISADKLSRKDLKFFITTYSLALAHTKRYNNLLQFTKSMQRELPEKDLHEALDETENYLIRKINDIVIKLFPGNKIETRNH